ncbi:MAG: hypothetical protein RI982_1055, partial [Bacteroidota bacterium]
IHGFYEQQGQGGRPAQVSKSYKRKFIG